MNNLDNEVLQDDEDSLTVILLRLVYEQKLQDMIDEGITNGKYEKTRESNFKDLKSYQSFLYRNVKNHNNGPFIYSDISSSSNEPATLHTPVKTCKFADFKNIATENLRTKIYHCSTCGTYYFQAVQSLAKYLVPLANNAFTI